jgi:hypothetical protein
MYATAVKLVTFPLLFITADLYRCVSLGALATSAVSIGVISTLRGLDANARPITKPRTSSSNCATFQMHDLYIVPVGHVGRKPRDLSKLLRPPPL